MDRSRSVDRSGSSITISAELFRDPFLGHIAPDGEAAPFAEFVVVAFDLFVGAGFFFVVVFVELRPQPRVQGEAVVAADEL